MFTAIFIGSFTIILQQRWYLIREWGFFTFFSYSSRLICLPIHLPIYERINLEDKENVKLYIVVLTSVAKHGGISTAY